MKYVLGVLGVILVAILAIVLILNSPNGNTSSNGKSSSSKLVDLATPSSTVSLTQKGELVGDQDRRSIRITITASERTVQILSGYNDNVIKSKTFANNGKAYQYFIAALGVAGFNLTQSSNLDERGACPNGITYDYKLNDGNKEVINTWSSTCNDGQGNFAGDSEDVAILFENQIPSFGDFKSGVQL